MNTEQKIEATTHELKTWPEYFEAVKYGKKTFELRHNDRNFQVGDELILKEWVQHDVFSSYDSHDPRIEDGHYTGEEIKKKVTYVLTGENVKRFGLMDGFCIIGLESGWEAIAESNRIANEEACKTIYSLQQGIAGRSAGLEREKEYRELLNIIRDDGGFEWLHSTTREKIEQLLNK